jgi:hypothetical protein
MFTCRYDASIPALVGIYSGSGPMRESWIEEEIYTDQLSRRALAMGVRGVYLHIIDPEVPHPDSVTRKDIAERAARAPAPSDYAMVTQSKLARGMLSIVSWFQKKEEFHRLSVHGDVESAIAALESRRKQKLPGLRTMVESARSEVTASLRKQA